MYQVIMTPNYYAGALGAPGERYITAAERDHDPQGKSDIAHWDRREEAEAWIEAEEDGIYALHHGEAGRPSYTIVEDCYNDAPDCISASGALNERNWTEVTDSIPTAIKTRLDDLNVEYESDDGVHALYTATTTDDDTTYKVVYCVRLTALQQYSDDLSGVDWDGAAYYIYNWLSI